LAKKKHSISSNNGYTLTHVLVTNQVIKSKHYKFTDYKYIVYLKWSMEKNTYCFKKCFILSFNNNTVVVNVPIHSLTSKYFKVEDVTHSKIPFWYLKSKNTYCKILVEQTMDVFN